MGLRQPGTHDAGNALLPPRPQRVDHRDAERARKMIAVNRGPLVSQRRGRPVGQIGRGEKVDADADHHRIAGALHQYAGAFGTIDQQVVGPFKLRTDIGRQCRDGFRERNPGDQCQRCRRRVADRQMDDGRTHEIALPVAPCPAEAAAPGSLTVGDEPVPFADMLAACQPRQQVGVGRTCLRDTLDRRDQKSTEAACADMAASTGMNK